MRPLLLITLSLGMLFFMGCTKQETKQNLKNVNEGLKNTWSKTKSAVSDSTKEFKEETK